jgi:hypothetical protein
LRGRSEDSCGSTGQGRPHRSEATRRLPGTPAESEAPGAQINRHVERPTSIIIIIIIITNAKKAQSNKHPIRLFLFKE